MATIVHLSDVHLRPHDERQAQLLVSMEAALRREIGSGGADLVVVTGDVFDSSKTSWEDADEPFRRLLGHIDAALGNATRIVVLPGNHDRRDSGVIGPHDPGLFRALGAFGSERVYIAGSTGNDLVELLPPVPTLDARLVAFDSTYLPRGLVSAGGWLRTEDLLLMASMTAGDPTDQPLIFCLHHHLVPTPLTDVGAIDVRGRPSWQRLLIQRALPWLVANGDREELTMTALGAGTALSLLHSLGRPIIVLHGHKHYATARALAGTHASEGDLLLTSAGSAGTSEPWQPTTHPGAMRLWPSFNVLRLEGAAVDVSAVAFSPKEPKEPARRRCLLSATREGRRWHVHPINEAPDFEMLVDLNAAAFTLETHTTYAGDAFDLRCRRTVRPLSAMAEYKEVVEGLPGGELVVEGQTEPRPLPAVIDVPLDRELEYVARRAICATVKSAEEAYGAGTAHEWVGLVNRYGTKRSVLSLDPGAAASGIGAVFGSITDLNTGRERYARARRDGARYVLEASDCAPRTLLRIYWCLAAPARTS